MSLTEPPSNSITANLTPQHFANEVAIVSSSLTRTVVLVEGGSDKRLYGKFLDLKSEQIIPALGKPSVLRTWAESAKRGIPYVLAIVDSDDVPIPMPSDVSAPTGSAILETGVRDAEILLLTCEPVVRAIVGAWCDPEKLEEDVVERRIIDCALGLAYPAGCIRLACKRQKHNVKLTHLPFEVLHKACDSGREAGIEQLCTIVSSRSHGALSRSSVETMFREVEAESLPQEHVCRGHDLSRAMIVVLQRSYKAPSHLGVDVLERSASALYGQESFSGTQLHGALREWEQETARGLLLAA